LPYLLKPHPGRKVAPKERFPGWNLRPQVGLHARLGGCHRSWPTRAQGPLLEGQRCAKPDRPALEPGTRWPRRQRRNRLLAGLIWNSSASFAWSRVPAGPMWPPGLAVKPRWCYSNLRDALLACHASLARGRIRALNSAVECHLHTVEVAGSNPAAPTIESIVYRWLLYKVCGVLWHFFKRLFRLPSFR
jgi:hypothetical protein